MNWTSDDMAKAESVYHRERPRGFPVRGVLNELMTLAVELVAARGGTMTAERTAIAQALTRLEAITANYEIEAMDALTRLLATVATLQAERNALQLKVEDLERQITGHEAQMDALHEALGVPPEGVDELDACRALQAKVAELEKTANDATAHWKELADGWQADALKTGRERDAASAEVERLKAELHSSPPDDLPPLLSSDQLAEAKRRIAANDVYPDWDERVFGHIKALADRLRACDAKRNNAALEVTRLKGVLSDLDRRWRDEQDRSVSAESRLAAIQLRVGKFEALPVIDRVTQLGQLGPIGFARWVLEGDASNSSTTSNGSGDAPQEAKMQVLLVGDDGPEAATREGLRYPCSPTCTHDDAATPGHPQRVKERSEAVIATLADARPETEDSASAIEEAAERDAYDRGAEAMRSAVEKWARQSFGEVPPTLKTVLDGAA